MSKIEDCALKPVGELPFVLEKGACQARLDDKVMLCFSGHESSDDYRDGYSDRGTKNRILFQASMITEMKTVPELKLAGNLMKSMESINIQMK